MIAKKIGSLILVIVIYLLLIYYRSPSVFSYKLDQSLIDRYFHSQDITHDVPGRIFLSDSDIHIASGYLYVNGYDPSKINFQHPPLIKYFFGLSNLFFNNPFIAQIGFGIILICLTYAFAFQIDHKHNQAFLASMLIATDSLLINMSSNAFLDLGQAVFILLFVYVSLFYPKKLIIQGVVLGLAFGSKFWAGALFFMILMLGFQIKSKNFNFRSFCKMAFASLVTFCAIYLPTFILNNFLFNIVFFELKTLKYWLNHSVTSYPLSSMLYFLTGYYREWWGELHFARSEHWSILWPVTIIWAGIVGFRAILQKKFEKEAMIFLIPILYLIYLGVQAPFDRYFIVILPYLYISLSYLIFKLTIGHKSL